MGRKESDQTKQNTKKHITSLPASCIISFANRLDPDHAQWYIEAALESNSWTQILMVFQKNYLKKLILTTKKHGKFPSMQSMSINKYQRSKMAFRLLILVVTINSFKPFFSSQIIIWSIH